MAITSSCLLTETRTLLQNRPQTVTLAKISADTGLKVSWLNYLLSENFPDAATTKVQTLYEYLSGEKLLKSTAN